MRRRGPLAIRCCVGICRGCWQSADRRSLNPNFDQVLHTRFPDLPNVPVGQPDTHEERNKQVPTFDGSKAVKVLGINYTPFEETVVEMGNSLRERFAF
jgi:hypothetical protein